MLDHFQPQDLELYPNDSLRLGDRVFAYCSSETLSTNSYVDLVGGIIF